MNRNHILLICLFLIVPAKMYATMQGLDWLIYEGERLSILSIPPLELLHKNDTIWPKYFGENKACWHTACARGYMAEWTIKDKKLYLTGIYSCCYHEDSIKADLRVLFGAKCKDGRVLADWVNEKLYSSKGKLIYTVLYRELYIFEKELEFKIVNREVLEISQLDNSKTRISEFAKEELRMRNFLRDQIDYSILPDPLTKKNVWVDIVSVTDQGKIDSVRVVLSADAIRDREAIRIVKSIPEWDVLYYHGKKLTPNLTIGIRFGAKAN